MCKELQELLKTQPIDNWNDNLNLISKILQIELNLEYNNIEYNVNVFGGSGIGKFMELLALEFNKGYVSSGSGGMGFDLVNHKTNKIVEVKSCCTIQNATCQNEKCKAKFNSLFIKECPLCKSKKYKLADDSRFGINADEFLREYNKNYFDNFTLGHLYLDNYNEYTKNINIKIDWFKIN
jgi:hypothetical protein